MATPTELEKIDLKTLQDLTLAIRGFLTWAVLDSTALKGELQSSFQTVLWTSNTRLENAIALLAKIEDTDSAVWQRLVEVGLTGDALKLKRLVWNQKVRNLSLSANAAPPRAPKIPSGPNNERGFFHTLVKPLFDWTNSFLGSLAEAIPGLDFVKEFKEMAELSAEFREDGDRPNRDFGVPSYAAS